MTTARPRARPPNTRCLFRGSPTSPSHVCALTPCGPTSARLLSSMLARTALLSLLWPSLLAPPCRPRTHAAHIGATSSQALSCESAAAYVSAGRSRARRSLALSQQMELRACAALPRTAWREGASFSTPWASGRPWRSSPWSLYIPSQLSPDASMLRQNKAPRHRCRHRPRILARFSRRSRPAWRRSPRLSLRPQLCSCAPLCACWRRALRKPA